MSVDAFCYLKEPAPLSLQGVTISLKRMHKHTKTGKKSSFTFAGLQLVVFGLRFLLLIAPDLDLVRCRVVILQEVVHFGLQPIQILFFYFQGTHQFLLYKKRWIITGDTGKTSGCSKREVLWLRCKWMTNCSCQNPIYHR